MHQCINSCIHNVSDVNDKAVITCSSLNLKLPRELLHIRLSNQTYTTNVFFYIFLMLSNVIYNDKLSVHVKNWFQRMLCFYFLQENTTSSVVFHLNYVKCIGQETFISFKKTPLHMWCLAVTMLSALGKKLLFPFTLSGFITWVQRQCLGRCCCHNWCMFKGWCLQVNGCSRVTWMCVQGQPPSMMTVSSCICQTSASGMALLLLSSTIFILFNIHAVISIHTLLSRIWHWSMTMGLSSEPIFVVNNSLSASDNSIHSISYFQSIYLTAELRYDFKVKDHV